MDPGQLMGTVASGVLLALAVFPARRAYECARDEMRDQMGRAVFSSVTKTAFFIGLPALIAVIVFLNSDARGGGGGIMSGGMANAVLFIGGCLALGLVWASALFLGLLGTLAARALPAPIAGLVVFGFISVAPLFGLSLYLGQQAQAAAERAARSR